jgi:4-hydroxy-2-oxoheptanedioate aldolase
MTQLSEAILHDTNGVTLTFRDPNLCALMRGKADFFVFDAVSNPVSPEILSAMIAASGDTPFLVRCTANAATAQQYLNMGADGLVLCGIQYASEAEKIMAACLYPPEGTRPYTPCAGTKFLPANDLSLETLNDQLTLVLEITHPQAVAQIEDIAEVTGVNGFLINAEKLAVAMEKGFNAAHADVQNAVAKIINAAEAVELPWGCENGTIGKTDPNFQIVTSDAAMLSAAANAYFSPEENDAEIPAGLRAVR